MSRIARPLLYLGVLVAVVGLSKLHAAEVGTYDYTGSSRFAWSFAYIALLALAAYGVGLPDVPRSRRSAVGSAVIACATAALAISGVQLLMGDTLLPRFVVLGAAAVLVPWYLLSVAVAVDTRAFDERRERVVVVGDHPEATSLGEELAHVPETYADVVVTLSVSDATVTSSSRPLVETVERTNGTVLVLDRAAQAEPSVVAQSASLHEGGVRVRTLSLFYEEWLGKLPVSELERVSLMFDIGEVHRVRYGRLKRLFDLGLTVPGLAALAVITPFVAIGNLVANRGPLVYRQERVGKGGRRFQILKFRTMRPEGDVLRDEWTSEDDPRITPFGHVLRVTHLDELPQVLNILRGELSVVGPRPEQPVYVEELVDKLPFYDLRHLVRPGLTGWAQVKYGYAGDERDALQKLQYEFFYLRRQGLALDLRIVGRTVRSVFTGDGR